MGETWSTCKIGLEGRGPSQATFSCHSSCGIQCGVVGWASQTSSVKSLLWAGAELVQLLDLLECLLNLDLSWLSE